jgi:hypothetical protein
MLQLMTKFGKSGKTRLYGFLFQTVQFWQFLEQEHDMSYTWRFDDPKCFEVLVFGSRGLTNSN